MVNIFKKFWIPVFIAALMAACNPEEEPCGIYQVPYLRCGIVLKQVIKIDSLAIYTDGLPDTISDPLTEKTAYLPLKPDTTFTYFYFTSRKTVKDSIKRDNGTYVYFDTTVFETDTIAFFHKSNLRLNDLECGFIVDFNIDSILFTTHYIDSILINTNVVNQEYVEHVKIYY